MAATRETLRLLGQMRIVIDSTVDAATDDLIRAWANGWQLVVRDWEAAAKAVQDIYDAGKVPTISQVLRAERSQRALAATYQGLQELGDHAGVRIIQGLGDVVQAASSGTVRIISSQLPAAHQALAEATLQRADTEQIRQIIVRTQEQVTKALFPLPGDSFVVIRRALVRGVQQGANPRDVARQIVADVHVGYGQALNRAMVIARTEMLDAHRAAAEVQHLTNADVLQGWQWVAALDHRTCPSCWAMHGTEHPLTEPGPLDHPQGRCTRLPLTKSWKTLGFEGREPKSLLPDASKAFARLPAAKQLQVMGPRRLAALNDGRASLGDMATRHSNIGWRDSYDTTRLADLGI